MKQRITFFSPEGSYVDVTSIKIGDDGLTYADAARSAAIEHRTTLGLDELPRQVEHLSPYGADVEPDLSAGFEQLHEIHVRWTSPTAHVLPSPLVSRLPAGLHVFWTPRKDASNSFSSDTLCRALKQHLGVNLSCDQFEDNFSRPAIQSERFAHAASYQYFQGHDHLNKTIESIRKITCSDTSAHDCEDRISAYSLAAQIDLDYDAISNAVVLTAVFPKVVSTNAQTQRLSIVNTADADTLEVGVLGSEKAEEPEELKLGGYLTVVGEDTKPSPVLFGFPSRHHPLPAGDKTTYKSTFNKPTGLHPTLSITFAGSTLQPPDESCALHAYLMLPSALFLDRYQLSEPDLLTMNNLRALHSLSGADDLEAPDWAVKQWGSAALLELRHPLEGATSKTWKAEIPSHLRYLQAEQQGDSATSRVISAPWPIVFWACEAEEGLKMNTNPFDRVNLGYDGLFGPKTMFYHIPPEGSRLTSELTVPTLDPATISWLPYSTLAVVLAGFTWILWSLLGPLPAKKHVKKE